MLMHCFLALYGVLCFLELFADLYILRGLCRESTSPPPPGVKEFPHLPRRTVFHLADLIV